MKLRALRLWNVGRFANRGVAIERIADGVNVLAAPNEAGKSTAFAALRALMFEKSSAKGRVVKALRPYSGGGPVVEADIDTADGLHRLRKRFFTKAETALFREGRLIARDDEAEAWLNALTQSGDAAPAGLLWVAQGEMEMAADARAPDRAARESVLNMVAGEIDALTGGKRMARVIANCRADLEALVTAKTLKPCAGGAYADACAERDRLTAKEAELAQAVRDVEDALAGRRSLIARLETLTNTEAVAARNAARPRGRWIASRESPCRPDCGAAGPNGFGPTRSSGRRDAPRRLPDRP